MKQQINLYQPIFRRQIKVFSSMTMVQISALFLIVFAAIYLYGEIKIQPFKGQLVTLDKNLIILNGELAKLQRQVPGSTGNKLMENEIARLTNELSKRRQVQSLLTNRIEANTEGLSFYLEAFARQHVQGTWLTKITIDQGAVTGDFTNIPVLINTKNFTDPTDLKDTLKDVANGGHVEQSDGGDIYFTSSDGTTRLNHEIELYTNSTGELFAWV